MKQKIRKNLSIWIGTFAYILFLVVCILFYAIDYITNVIQVESFSQFLYTMQVGMGGAGNTVVQILQGFAVHYLFWIACATLLYGLFLKTALRQRKYEKEGQGPGVSRQTIVTLNSTVIVTALVITGVLACQIREGYSALKIDRYLEEQNLVSTLYEDHYVAPDSVSIQPPAKKKNLIYIYMESMESTYADRNRGGGFQDNLIPELTHLADEQTNFRAADDEHLNGGMVTNNTSWTVAGMVAQTSGTPLGVANSSYNKSFSEEMKFMPHVTALGDILEQQGYHNVLMCGSEASYAGRANYFRQHGDYDIFDLDAAHESGALPEDYHEWWGFEDAKLMDFARQALTKLAAEDQPFNFTMLTADTHFKDGYLCPDCPDLYDEPYENVIHCSDHRVADLVHWIMQQDFYQDSVIILSGDHLSMDGLVNQTVGLDFPRRTYFCIVNGADYTLDQTRQFTTLDIFPTTLEALGNRIDGHRLGLGTSLYADVPTLAEQYGFDWLNRQITYRSVRYENEILKDDGLDPMQSPQALNTEAG